MKFPDEFWVITTNKIKMINTVSLSFSARRYNFKFLSPNTLLYPFYFIFLLLISEISTIYNSKSIISPFSLIYNIYHGRIIWKSHAIAYGPSQVKINIEIKNHLPQAMQTHRIHLLNLRQRYAESIPQDIHHLRTNWYRTQGHPSLLAEEDSHARLQ